MNTSPPFEHSCFAPRVVGITGGTGSGKSTIAQSLLQHCGSDSALVLQIDHYYHDHSHLPLGSRRSLNFDHPEALDSALLLTHLRALLDGQCIECPRYDFPSHSRLPHTVTVSSKPLIILEGLLLFLDPNVREFLDILVFVDAPDDVRFIRRLRRDVLERGRTMESVLEQYLASVRPMHQAFVAPTKAVANVIVSGEEPLASVVDRLMGHVAALFASVPVGHAAKGGGA